MELMYKVIIVVIKIVPITIIIVHKGIKIHLQEAWVVSQKIIAHKLKIMAVVR